MAPAHTTKLRCGVAVIAVTHLRFSHATIQSIARLARPADAVSVFVPVDRCPEIGSERVNDWRMAMGAPILDCRTGCTLEQELRKLAAKVDILVIVPAGVIFLPDYLTHLLDNRIGKNAVGGIDLVYRTIDIGQVVDATARDLGATRSPRRNFAFTPRWLRARSTMPTILWALTSACGEIAISQRPDVVSFISQALLLDRLRPRGKTAVHFTQDAAYSAACAGPPCSSAEAIYRRLQQTAAFDPARAEGTEGGRTSHLKPRTETLRLFGQHALQLFALSGQRSAAVETLQTLWRARQCFRAQQRRIRREIRELS